MSNCSWRSPEGTIVHIGEKHLRKDGTSDWPWTDCGERTAFMVATTQAPNCFWCIVGVDIWPEPDPKASKYIGPWK